MKNVNQQNYHPCRDESRTGNNVIVFNILNSAATQLSELHALSDAGAGQHLMHLTPTRDSELLVNGCSQTPFPITPPSTALTAQGLLDNGGISPAVLSRGLLKHLSNLGYQIEFKSFNFGVARPLLGHSEWISHCDHFGGIDADTRALVDMHLFPELVSQSQRGCISILAECGVGGTTFSTLWLRLLTGLSISPAGSTKDALKLARKSELLSQLMHEYKQFSSNFDAGILLRNPRFHDEIQLALYLVLQRWPQSFVLPRFAGGMMFLAPILAVITQRPGLKGRIDTTRWVVQPQGCKDRFSIEDHLPSLWQLHLHQTNFALSHYSCLQVFEQGLVVEGCGLGGLLVLLEEIGEKPESIIAALEGACATHMDQFTHTIKAVAV